MFFIVNVQIITFEALLLSEVWLYPILVVKSCCMWPVVGPGIFIWESYSPRSPRQKSPSGV